MLTGADVRCLRGRLSPILHRNSAGKKKKIGVEMSSELLHDLRRPPQLHGAQCAMEETCRCWTCRDLRLPEMSEAAALDSRNLPGFAEGAASSEFLSRMEAIDARMSRLEVRLSKRISPSCSTTPTVDMLISDCKPHSDGLSVQISRPVAGEASAPRTGLVNGHTGVSGIKSSPTQRRLHDLLLANKCIDFKFCRVPSDYYDLTFEQRQALLGAASVEHLCKSIVMVNTQAADDIVDCNDRNNSKYYLVVVQYAAKLNAEKIRAFVHSLNKGNIPKKRFNMRLAPEAISNELTGFEHNAVTPIGMRTNIPVILSKAIVNLKPDFFWLGGGEVDLKLGIQTTQFIDLLDPFIVDIS